MSTFSINYFEKTTYLPTYLPTYVHLMTQSLRKIDLKSFLAISCGFICYFGKF